MKNLPPAYEIRVDGQLDDVRAAAFGGLDVTCRGQVTIITGEFDQAALHGLLERIWFFGLELIEARRIGDSRRRAAQ